MDIHTGFVSEYFVDNFIFKKDLTDLLPIRWIQVLLSSTYSSIQYQLFIFTQGNVYHYCYLTLIILFHLILSSAHY